MYQSLNKMNKFHAQDFEMSSESDESLKSKVSWKKFRKIWNLMNFPQDKISEKKSGAKSPVIENSGEIKLPPKVSGKILNFPKFSLQSIQCIHLISNHKIDTSKPRCGYVDQIS